MRRFLAPGAFALPAGMPICAFPFVSAAPLTLGIAARQRSVTGEDARAKPGRPRFIAGAIA
jgi:hypothetical protein